MSTLTKSTAHPVLHRTLGRKQPFDTWILEKVWLNDGLFDRSDCFAFDSFWAANRAMFDDWTEEYDGRPDDDSEDGYWDSQVRPFEDDDEAEIKFRDGVAIQWKIYNCSIENLNPLWDKKEA